MGRQNWVKRAWGFAFTYTGAVLGAGFFSGREIWYFFARNGLFGFYGIMITALFFILIAPLIFRTGKSLGICNYHQFFYEYLPYYFAFLFDLIFSLFFLGSFAIMLAGSGTLLNESLHINYSLGICISLMVIFFILLLKVNGIYRANSYFIPFILLITVIIIVRFIPEKSVMFIKEIIFDKIKLTVDERTGWIKDAVLYGSYNLAMASGIMIGIARNEDSKTVVTGSVVGGLFLFLLNILIFIGLKTAYYQTPTEEIPMLYIALKNGGIFYYLYIIGLFFAMISTAIANCYALTQRFKYFNIKYIWSLLIIFIIAVPFLRFGFSSLVETLYPLFGYMGFVMLVLMVYKYLVRSFNLS